MLGLHHTQRRPDSGQEDRPTHIKPVNQSAYRWMQTVCHMCRAVAGIGFVVHRMKQETFGTGHDEDLKLLKMGALDIV